MEASNLGRHYLEVVTKTFADQKRLAEGALLQLEAEQVHWRPDPESNSIAVIVKHMSGNMVSRWTELLTSDGEKESRDRDAEFVADGASIDTLMAAWEAGWARLFAALEGLSPGDLLKTVTIRGEAHTVLEALERQVSHYGYHVGQIVYLAKLLKASDWRTLSIPKGQSKTYRDKASNNGKGS